MSASFVRLSLKLKCLPTERISLPTAILLHSEVLLCSSDFVFHLQWHTTETMSDWMLSPFLCILSLSAVHHHHLSGSVWKCQWQTCKFNQTLHSLTHCLFLLDPFNYCCYFWVVILSGKNYVLSNIYLWNRQNWWDNRGDYWSWHWPQDAESILKCCIDPYGGCWWSEEVRCANWEVRARQQFSEQMDCTERLRLLFTELC